MPWELREFERERLEKGRRLLQESEEHRGSRDLRAGPPAACPSPRPARRQPAAHPAAPCCVQLYVESLDLTAQMHCIFLDDSGRQRQGLTAEEKLQVLPAPVEAAAACTKGATWPPL